MELFNEYYNSDIQFFLDIFSLKREFSKKEIIDIATKNHVFSVNIDYRDNIVRWMNSGLIEKCENDKYQIGKKMHSFVSPILDIEYDYLQDICHTAEAELFFDDSPIVATEDSILNYIDRKNTQGKKNEVYCIDKEVFRNLLKAIREGLYIEHTYSTNINPALRTAKIIPYRLEHSVFDGRWWLISYLEQEQRPIKSRLENIKSVRLLEKHNTSESIIQKSILDHMAENEVVLIIHNEKNVLERCFKIFENMFDMTAYKHDNNLYELRFRYLEWDRHVIVRKLMYLGEHVKIQSPDIIKYEVIKELKSALKI